MELQELKQKWNALDERLSKSEVYNRQILKKMLQEKTNTIFQRMSRQGLFNGIVIFFIMAVVIPLLHEQEIYRDVTAYILEGVCGIGLLMLSYRLYFLSRFDVMDSPESQMQNLISYKRCYVREAIIGAPLVIIGIGATLCMENTSSPLGIISVAIGICAGGFCAWLGYREHSRTMREIEQNLMDLQDFIQE